MNDKNLQIAIKDTIRNQEHHAVWIANPPQIILNQKPDPKSHTHQFFYTPENTQELFDQLNIPYNTLNPHPIYQGLLQTNEFHLVTNQETEIFADHFILNANSIYLHNNQKFIGPYLHVPAKKLQPLYHLNPSTPSKTAQTISLILSNLNYQNQRFLQNDGIYIAVLLNPQNYANINTSQNQIAHQIHDAITNHHQYQEIH